MELENTNKSSFTDKPALRFNELEVNSLVDYIVDNHHAYIRKSVPDLFAHLKEVANSHGAIHPELISISRLFHEVSTELNSHLLKEESIVFPFIKKYLSGSNSQEDLQKEQINKILPIINKMELEHDVFGRKMDMIRVLSGNYILPHDSSESYARLFKLLKEFENDFFIHLHLENHILFPKVFLLEQK
ncbi:MAG: hemerythrin domain-containing protein [Ginsengibacter sp.]